MTWILILICCDIGNPRYLPQSGESDWVYVLESVDAFNKFLVGAGLDNLGDKDDTRIPTLIHVQRERYVQR